MKTGNPVQDLFQPTVFIYKKNYCNRHSGAGRNPEKYSGAYEEPWTPASAGVTKKCQARGRRKAGGDFHIKI